VIDKNAGHWGKLKRRNFISYWEDVKSDGLFIAWLAVK